MKCDFRASISARTFRSPCLGHEPKVRVVTSLPFRINFHVPMCTHFLHSWEDFSTTCFCQCLILKRANEYSHVVRAFQPMMPTIPLEDTIATSHQLHPPPLNLIFPSIFYYQPKHIFVLDKTMFTQSLTIIPHLTLNGLSRMVYEHLLWCFIPKDPSSKFLELFQVGVVIAHRDIPRLVALMLGVSKLLAMANDTSGLCLIAIVFLRLINRSIVLQLQGLF
jgi:hypothetical protein